MADEIAFDEASGHRFFSADCFNKARSFIEKAERTPEENRAMIDLVHASLYHWSQRGDATATNLSIGYWQAARVHALAGQLDIARQYGELCLEVSQNEEPFYLAYAHEALARTESLAGNVEKAKEHLHSARELAEKVEDPESKQMVMADLEKLGG